MTATHPRLYLVAPPASDLDTIAGLLSEACAPGGIAAVLLRLAAADERTLVNRIKRLAPVAQEAGAAVLIAHDDAFDAAAVGVRGGADGVHVGAPDPSLLVDLRRRLGAERILGAGGLRLRDDAMNAGEAGVDYVMFGEPRPDGSVPAPDTVVERASWWAEIFRTPCVAFAPDLESIGALAGTGAEFIALGEAVFGRPDGPRAAVEAALAALGCVEAVR